MTPAHLRLVDADTGELVEQNPFAEIERLTDLLAGAETDVRAWRTRYAKLKREEHLRAQESPLWPVAVELFSLWKRLCKHPRSSWGADRFLAVEEFLTDPKYGREKCELAIRGAAFQPYVTRRKNGSEKRHDDWGLIFRNRDKFEEMCCRAPREAS